MKLSHDARPTTADSRATVLALILLSAGCSPASGATPTSASSPTPPATVDVAASDVLRGTIEFRIGAHGGLVGVKVVSKSGGTADEWERIAAAARAALADKKIPDEYARGGIFWIDVTA